MLLDEKTLTEETVQRMVFEARQAAERRVRLRLKELEAAGPAWQVVDARDPNAHLGDPGWQLHDLCGFAWVKLNENGNSRKMRLLKKVINSGTYERLHKAYYGGWEMMSEYRGQEVSVNEAWCKGFAEVLKQYGYNAYTDTRLD